MEILTQIYKQIPRLSECPFATLHDNKASVREMTLLFVDQNFFIVTGKQSTNYKDLEKNKSFEWYLVFKSDEPVWYLRARGNAEFIEDPEQKKYIFDEIDFIKYYWDKPEHDLFALIKCNPNEFEYNLKDQEESHIINL